MGIRDGSTATRCLDSPSFHFIHRLAVNVGHANRKIIFRSTAQTCARLHRQDCEPQATPYRKPFPEPCAALILARMGAHEATSADTLEARLNHAVTAWAARKGMTERAFGVAALGDPDFFASLVRGRSPRLATVDRVLAFMGEAPVGPAFRAEVEAFLAVTGIKRSLFGREATGNPSFVAHLRRGVSPTLATVRRVRVWMAAHASAAELREIRERVGAPPAILAGSAMIECATPRGPLSPVQSNRS